MPGQLAMQSRRNHAIDLDHDQRVAVHKVLELQIRRTGQEYQL